VALWWLIHKKRGKQYVFVVEAPGLILARMKGKLAGEIGAYAEGHELDEASAKQVPDEMRGRWMSMEDLAVLAK
jgi:hypothetical protein